MRRVLVVVLTAAVVAVGLGWFVVANVSRLFRSDSVLTGAPPAAAPAEPERKIQASLFYVSEDGMRLVAVQREVPYGADMVEQARHLVEEQVKPAPAPYAQAIPDGTTLRGVYLGQRGEAFVDLSADITAAHTGGSLDELFAVYAIVNALTVNLPAISRVQILVGGQEVDSLAGHIDLRRPLPKNLTWVTSPGAVSPDSGAATGSSPASSPPAAPAGPGTKPSA